MEDKTDIGLTFALDKQESTFSIYAPIPQTPQSTSKLSLRRNTSFGNMPPTDKTEAKVLVIYTGGTIGMMRNDKNGKIISYTQNKIYMTLI